MARKSLIPCCVDGHTRDAIAAQAQRYNPGVSPAQVREVRFRLRGHHAPGGFAGPVGVAYTALRRPQDTTAAVIIALDDVGDLLTHPEGHPFHNPERALLARTAELLRKGGYEAQRAAAEHLRRLLDADPSGSYPPKLGAGAA